MAEINLNRSVHLVSLDTHPANNSLVVTYEILVIASESNSGRELTRRSKRDQFQIHITALDQLSQKDLASSRAQFDLRQLSEEILRKCPMLLDGVADTTKALEDVQVNLLYLFNRRQAQLCRPSSSTTKRPPSSAISSSATSSQGRLSRAGSATPTASLINRKDLNKRGAASNPLDIYTRLYGKHLDVTSGRSDPYYALLDEFTNQMDAYLQRREHELGIDPLAKSQLADFDLDSQLEGLYGDQDERKQSIAAIRQYICMPNDEKLLSASTNRLLVCAMLRTLRDLEGTKHHFVSESILYCLLRFSTYEDVLERMSFSSAESGGSTSGDWVDLARVVIDLLDRQIKWFVSSGGHKGGDNNLLSQIVASFYYTNSLLIVLTNLISYLTDKVKLMRVLIQQHGNKLAEILSDSLVFLAKYLARDTRAPTSRYERLTVTLSLITGIAQQLVVFRDFILLLRRASSRPAILVNSIISLLNILQLCRPGSGTTQQQQQQQFMISDQTLLLDIYELELELIKLITNLTYDARLRARFLRKNLLLKCVLRNLVIFLAASRKSNTLSPFDQSPVLMVPFKCLYELSCCDTIKSELFKSKIIMKCLLEYLLSSAADLTAEQETRRKSLSAKNERKKTTTSLDLNEDDQILFRPQSASHYIVAFWLNLSAQPAAPIYNLTAENEELREPLCDYLQLIVSQLESFMRLTIEESAPVKLTRAIHLSVYVHCKLLRNFSQFIHEFSQSKMLLQKLCSACQLMLENTSRAHQEFVPLTVEALASLTNFIDKPSSLETSSSLGNQLDLEKVLTLLFDEGYQLDRGFRSVDSENDDLLLVSINLLGALARNREICNAIKSLHSGLLSLLNATLELKQPDNEMLISCLFTLRQLIGHSSFLQDLGQRLEHDDQQALALVEALSLLLMHSDASVIKLSNSILNTLKHFEELHSLAGSVTGERRFIAYNSKWLDAIRANREEPRDDLLVERRPLARTTGVLRQQDRDLQVRDETEKSLRASQDDDPELMDLDYNQLRTINELEPQSSSSSRLSTSSSLGARNLKRAPKTKTKTKSSLNDENHDEDYDEEEDDDHDEEDEEDEEEEETFSEPDLNVIDANSMIKHLTSRREFRAELLRR